MSAFNRLPKTYLDLCRRIAKAWTLPKQQFKLSPQNRRVRFAADLHLASQKSFPNRVTRQQRRAAERPWKQRAA
jgi:hypothetical protein